MTLWPCSICHATDRCDHREPELVSWINGLEAAAAKRAIAQLASDASRRIPPARADENTRAAHVARPMLARSAAR